MKFQNILFLVLAISFLGTGTTFGQKLKDKNISCKYVRLPLKQLPDDHMTYSVNVYGSAISQAGSSPQSLANQIKMDGFKRLSGSGNDFGHIRVSVYTGYAYINSGESKSKTTTRTDKKTGKETKTTSYWTEYACRGTASYKFVGPDGSILFTREIPKTVTNKSKTYTSSSARYKDRSAARSRIRSGFARDLCNSAVSSANSTLRSNYDYSNASYSENIYSIKKHATEAQFMKYQELIEKVFKEKTATTPTSELKEALADALAFYEKTSEKDAKGDKKLARIQKAATHNLAVLSFYLDDLDRAEALANKVIKIDGGKDRRAKQLIKQVNDTKKRLAANNIKTMHFQRDISAAQAPSQIAAFEEIKEEIAEENNSIAGSIMMGDQMLEGKIIQSKESEQMSFGPSGNTKFIVEKDGKIEEYDLSKSNITSFKVGERSFARMNFKPCAKGKSEVASHILEEVYASDKINLYKYYPTSGAMSNESVEYAFKKTSDAAPISLLDTQFLILKKGLANYFSDCADLKGMAEEGTFELKEDSLIKAARIYAELCE